MNRIYLDWNVLTHMKQGRHNELAEFLNNNPQFELIYSTAHISDILVSYNGTEENSKWIADDLSFLSSITKNLCAHIENKEVVISQCNPHELFSDRISETEIFNKTDFFDVLLESVQEISEAYQVVLQLKNQPYLFLCLMN